MGHKICVSCNTASRKRSRIGAWHPIYNFHDDAATEDGLHGACKDCRNRTRLASRAARLIEKQRIPTCHTLLNQATRAIHGNA